DAVVAADQTGGVLSLSGEAITNAGMIEADNGGFLGINAPTVANSGTIMVTNGEATIGSVVTGLGAIELGPNSLTRMTNAASIINNIVFTGGSATLKVDAVGSVEGELIGAGSGTAIDVTFVAPTAHVLWQQNGGIGKLSLVDNNGNALAGFTLQG